MKITIYELLGMVKEGKAPQKIKVGNKIYNYETFSIGKGDSYFTAEWEEVKGYRTNYDDTYDYLKIRDYNLNDKVEILEDEKQETEAITKKDFEALGYACGEIQKAFTNGWSKSLENKPLEDEKKIPKKLNIRYKNDDIIINEKILQEDLNTELADKINEILDYLETKGDE